MNYDPYREHMQQSILCADPLELVVMLYEGLGESISAARRALQAGDIAGRANSVSRAMEILAELSASLDRERGAELASGLARLYEFISTRLQEGNFTQQDQAFAEAGRVVATLLDAWREIRPAAAKDHVACALPNFEPASFATLSACG
jgi:flagellar protein FliS